MKRTSFAVIALLAAASPVAVLADTVEVDQGPYQFSDSGELITLTSPENFEANYNPVAIDNNGNVTGFASFAADSDLPVTYNTPYSFTLSQVDSQGHVLTQGAALLYYDFAEDLFPNSLYNYTDADNGYYRIQDAGMLQTAIWAFQSYPNAGSQYPNGGAGNPFYDYALSVDPTALLPNDGTYNVDIMDLTDANGDAAQNLLVIPDEVPDGGSTLSMLACGLVAFGVSRKKLAATRAAL